MGLANLSLINIVNVTSYSSLVLFLTNLTASPSLPLSFQKPASLAYVKRVFVFSTWARETTTSEDYCCQNLAKYTRHDGFIRAQISLNKIETGNSSNAGLQRNIEISCAKST